MRRLLLTRLSEANQLAKGELNTNDHLTTARFNLAEAEYALEVRKAQAEQGAIDIAGGEKNLGSNEEARRRAFTLVLHADAEYQRLRRDIEGKRAIVRNPEGEARYHNALRQNLLAFLTGR